MKIPLHRLWVGFVASSLGFAAAASGAPAAAAEPARRVRVAASSFVPKPLDLAGNAAGLEREFRRAAAGGAQLAVAPEASLDAYIAIDIINGRQPPERMREMAVTLDSPVIRRFQSLAQELHLCLVFGFAERVGENVYDAAVFIDQTGKICGDYHKMQLAEGTCPAWWFNRVGEHCRAFDTPLGRCGLLICNDRWNADLAKILALDGAGLIIIPTDGSSDDSNEIAVLARARENGVPIVQANQHDETLIVDRGAVVATSRAVGAFTYGEIAIPLGRPVAPEARDAVEAGFLRWREQEMPKRYEKTMDEVHRNTAAKKG